MPALVSGAAKLCSACQEPKPAESTGPHPSLMRPVSPPTWHGWACHIWVPWVRWLLPWGKSTGKVLISASVGQFGSVPWPAQDFWSTPSPLLPTQNLAHIFIALQHGGLGLPSPKQHHHLSRVSGIFPCWLWGCQSLDAKVLCPVISHLPAPQASPGCDRVLILHCGMMDFKSLCSTDAFQMAAGLPQGTSTVYTMGEWLQLAWVWIIVTTLNVSLITRHSLKYHLKLYHHCMFIVSSMSMLNAQDVMNDQVISLSAQASLDWTILEERLSETTGRGTVRAAHVEGALLLV